MKEYLKHRLQRARGRWNENAGSVHADGVAKQVADASEGLLGGIRECLGAEVSASADNAALKDDVEQLVDAVVDEAVADGAERKLEGLQNKVVNTRTARVIGAGIEGV